MESLRPCFFGPAETCPVGALVSTESGSDTHELYYVYIHTYFHFCTLSSKICRAHKGSFANTAGLMGLMGDTSLASLEQFLQERPLLCR